MIRLFFAYHRAKRWGLSKTENATPHNCGKPMKMMDLFA
jgi:hypothetical protein